VSVRIYVEGGFEGSTKSNCRKAFSAFLAKVVERVSFKVIASGDRANAYKDFCSALRQHPDDFIILLVDSETEVATIPWQHLKTRHGDNWDRPKGVTDDQAHLMVQVMEAWFLADQQAVSVYYGKDFLADSLPRQTNIEKIEKKKVFEVLDHATKNTQKGRYHKTRHGFEVLELINPELVQTASVHAQKFFAILRRET
jgi:hypothetical protein